MAGTATSPEVPVNELNAEDEVAPGEPDETLEAMKARVEQMEREAAQLRDMQAGYAHGGSPAPAIAGEHPPSEDTNMEGDEDKEAADMRSVYVGNVDYGATPEEIQAHFQSCGTINRVTILCDKFTGHPKGYAYVEFAEPTHVQHAVVLNDSMFRGRLIKVTAKRTNIPGFNRGRGRGRGYRGGFRASFNYQPYRARGRAWESQALYEHTMHYRIPQIFLRRYASEAVQSSVYPFSNNIKTPPPPISNPTRSLLNGKGLMAQLYKSLPSEQMQEMLGTLFSRRHPKRILPGSVLTVTSNHAPTAFTGVLLGIRRRGPGTSFTLRNVIQRTGVEMQFFVGSPHIKSIQIVQKATNISGKNRKGGLRRAKLFYLRNSPDKMSQISTNMKS